MDKLTAVAIQKAASKAADKSAIPAGTHEVDVTVRVQGTVTKGEDFTRTPTVNIPIKAALALFMRYSGATGTAATRALEKAMTEALTLDTKAIKAISEMADIDTTMKKVVASTKAMPAVTVSGQTTADLTITEV